MSDFEISKTMIRPEDTCQIRSRINGMGLPHSADHIIEWVFEWPGDDPRNRTHPGLKRATKAMCMCGTVFEIKASESVKD